MEKDFRKAIDVELKVLQNSLQMYKNTINDLSEKGKETKEIEKEIFDIESRVSRLKSIKDEKEAQSYFGWPGYATDISVPGSENKVQPEPLQRSRFLVRFTNYENDVPSNQIIGVGFTHDVDKGKPNIRLLIWDSVETSVLKFFLTKGFIPNSTSIVIDYLDPKLEPVLRLSFSGVRLKKINPCSLNYYDSGLITNEFVFEYDYLVNVATD